MLPLHILGKIEVCRGAEAQAGDCERNRLSVRSPIEEIKYLIFSFLRSVWI